MSAYTSGSAEPPIQGSAIGLIAIGDNVRVSGHIGAGTVGKIGRATGPSVIVRKGLEIAKRLVAVLRAAEPLEVRGELIAVEHAIEARTLLCTVGT